jgi:hypothetical protein
LCRYIEDVREFYKAVTFRTLKIIYPRHLHRILMQEKDEVYRLDWIHWVLDSVELRRGEGGLVKKCVKL